MQVLLAEEFGFCFGVERAVEMVEDALAQGATVRTLGPLIHNTQEIERLESHGVATLEQPSDVEGEVTAVIRAHGSGVAAAELDDVVDELVLGVPDHRDDRLLRLELDE